MISTSAKIRALFEGNAQQAYYGVEVTKWQHAMQIYQLDREEKADIEFCIAAFLDNIGILYPKKQMI
jgi:predicted HD phosphohydrolase